MSVFSKQPHLKQFQKPAEQICVDLREMIFPSNACPSAVSANHFGKIKISEFNSVIY
jgi:hypothetical protein